MARLLGCSKKSKLLTIGAGKDWCRNFFLRRLPLIATSIVILIVFRFSFYMKHEFREEIPSAEGRSITNLHL